jgi:general secretion pathway protein G
MKKLIIKRLLKKGLDKEGFTLIELLVVMIILGLLAALVGPKFFSHVGKAKTKAAKAQIELLGIALDTMRLDIGRYPTTEEGLEALRKNPGIDEWDGPYLKKETPMDPWKNPYLYTYPSENGLDFDILSYGADGASGGEGENQDVANWKDLNKSPG